MSTIKTNPSERAPRHRRGHGRVTLDDVARMAGVTSITVSRFLREPARVADATATRIRDALAALGYVAHKQAGQLASGHSNMVAAIIPNIANSIFAETVQGLADALQASGYELLLASTGYSQEREEEQIRAVLGWHPGALAVTGRHHNAGALVMLRAARDAGLPVVELWDHQAGTQEDGDAVFAQIGFDHVEVGRTMARHLLALGRRRLGYVDSAVAEDFRAHERGTGFADAARAGGATVELITAEPGDAFDAGRRALLRLLDAGRAGAGAPVDAAAFANDHLACGALLEARARRIAVPARIAVLGFGDFPIGRQMEPALSTVHPPRYEIGHAAGRMLVAAMASQVPPSHHALAWTLVERASTVAPPPSAQGATAVT